MPEKYLKTRILIVAILVVAISALHYITKIDFAHYHIFYLEIYWLPLILSGFWFGFRGGLITSLTITILYVPELVTEWQGFSAEDFNRILAILLFNIAGPGLGFITDRGKAQEKARIEAEHIAREQAESISRLKSDFLSIISHELRTPLINIIGYNDLLLDGVAGSLTEEQIDALKKIDRSSKQLLEIINVMIDFSRLEAESVEMKEVSVSDLIKEVESETQSLREKPGLNFIWKIEREIPHVRTDPAKLKVALKNLISNAVKFTEKGSVTVDVHKYQNGVEIEVIDTGIGISSEDLPIIFEPFRQIENPLTRRRGGIGLGLYIVKRLLEILAGKITVESEVGRGSTFRVWIPSP